MRLHQCPDCGRELADVDGVDVCRHRECGWRSEPESGDVPEPSRSELDVAKRAAREAIRRAKESSVVMPPWFQKPRVSKADDE